MSEQLIDGQFSLGSMIASDGTGEVYEGVQVKLNRKVSIKMLAAGQSDEAVARFEREAEALARLNHPGIVFVVDFGVHEGRPYLVREAVTGETLEARLEAGQIFTPEEAVPILAQIASALEHAHQSNVVHRDLRPANILLHEDGRVRVTDFALAKILDQEGEALTAPGAIVGASWYMSPEQVRGSPADTRSDLYALGVIAHRMLTGRFPFDEPELADMLSRQQKETPPPLVSLISAGEEATFFLTTIDKMLAPDPEQRHPSATWVVNALDRAASDMALPDATEEAELVPATSPPPMPERTDAPSSSGADAGPSLEDWAEASSLPESPDEELEIDGAVDAPPRPRGSWKAPAAAVYVLSIVAVTFFVSGELPDAAREARGMIRAGRSVQVIPQLEKFVAEPNHDRALGAALGQAYVHVGAPKKAVAAFESAANGDPSVLEPADVAALVAYLGMNDDTSLNAERVLVRVGSRARPLLRSKWEDEESDPFLRCRAGHTLRAMGETLDLSAACGRAVESESCAIHGMAKAHLDEIGAATATTSCDT